MATFPLQTKINKESFEETPPDRVFRTNMDVGEDKTRRRSSKGPREVKFKMFPLTGAEIATLDSFFLTNDAIKFDITHPRTDSLVKARFLRPPVYRTREVDWEVNCNLEFLS